MNARQKAKKLKKELDFLKSYPLKPTYYRVINTEAEHLRAYRIFSLEEIKKYGEETIDEITRQQLANEFLKFISENMIVNKDKDIDSLDNVKYSTDIWIGFGRK